MTLPNTIHTIRIAPPGARRGRGRGRQRIIHASSATATSRTSIDPEQKERELQQVQQEMAHFCQSYLASLSIEAPSTPLHTHGKRRATTPPPAPRKQQMTRGRSKSVTKHESDQDEWDDSASEYQDEDEDMEEDDEEEEEEEEQEEKQTKKKKKCVKADGIERRSKLPLPAVHRLRTWFVEHVDHPYPSEHDKSVLGEETGLTSKQITNWFTNTRKRFWVPFVSQMNNGNGNEE